MSDTTTPQAKITLHWLEVSRAHRILWLLEELGCPYELKTYKRQKDRGADPKLKEVHPLGKSPVLTVEAPGEKPFVLIESANIVEYLCDYYGKHLIPNRYQQGKEGKIGGETEEFLRYRQYMHYAEGSIMPLMVTALLNSIIRTSPVPFLLKPVTSVVASKIQEGYLDPNFKLHFTWLESQLETSPNGGQYLCGKDVTAADILMSFPMEAAEGRATKNLKKDYPRCAEFLNLLHQRDAFKRSVKKIEEIEGKFETNILPA